MRMFIAINFNEKIKEEIQEIISAIKDESLKGRFVKSEHIHLTLEFLGEISEERIKEIKEYMDELSIRPFVLEFSKIGYFKRKVGNIYWIGIKENKSLVDLQAEIHKKLKKKDFKLDNRRYTPHITIGRGIIMKNKFNPNNYLERLKNIEIEVNSICLYKSERDNGKYKHILVYKKVL